MKLMVSAFRLSFESDSFSAKKLAYTNDDEFKLLREQYEGVWFLYRRSSQGIAHEVIALPLVDGVDGIEGKRSDTVSGFPLL